MRHRIVAIQVKEERGEMVINLLGQTPRGTRFIIKSAKAGSANAPKAELKRELDKAIRGLLPEELLPTT